MFSLTTMQLPFIDEIFVVGKMSLILLLVGHSFQRNHNEYFGDVDITCSDFS